jgi:hypothetical protein
VEYHGQFCTISKRNIACFLLGVLQSIHWSLKTEILRDEGTGDQEAQAGDVAAESEEPDVTPMMAQLNA